MTKTIIALSAFLALAAPGLASAATYAYVNQSGNVSTVEANTPNLAMDNAPSIDIHSGVILLSSLADGIIGDHVGGI